MSERCTDVSSGPGTPGLMDLGRKTRAEMVGQYYAYYQRQREQAERALAVRSEDLVVTTFLGPVVMRKREVVR